MNIRYALAITAFLLLGASTPAISQPKPDVTAPTPPGIERMMFVGNSFFYYNNGISGFVSRLAGGSPEHRKLGGTMVTIGGSGFDWHDMESYFRPHAIGYYDFDSENRIIFNQRTKYYDAVLMMDCSQCPIHPQLAPIFTDYARRNAEIARAHGVEPMLFMSWAYQDHPEMTAPLADAYTRAGNDNHALVIPAGLAFARVQRDRPDIILYQPDRRHPTPAGSYLAAAVIYAAVTGLSPQENSYTADLGVETAGYLRQTAWQVTRAFYGR